MDRRLFTAGLAASAAASLATSASANLNQFEDEDRIELLQIPNLRRFRNLFRDAPQVIARSDLANIPQNDLSLILSPQLNTWNGSSRITVRGLVKDLSRPLLTMDGTAAGAPRMGDHDLEFSGNVYATGDPGLLVRDVRTEVTIRSGESIVIGGLMHNTPEIGRQEDLSLPFLGELPVIGHAFRSTAQSNRHRELVIFVTAQLVRPD